MPKPKTPTSFQPVTELGYRVKSMIGQGGFGSVYIAVHEPTKSFRAVKAMFKGDTERAEIDNEVDMMRRTDHAPNVARLLEVAEDGHFIFICLEACMGGHLLKRLSEHRVFTERHAAVAIADVLSALAVLHGMGIAHRDIKPQNLIYFNERPDAPLKLIDFGMAVDLRKAPGGKVTEFAGTIRFMSPSIVKEQPYGCECDLWALGVTAYLLLSGTYPFNGATVDEVAHVILHADPSLSAPLWGNVSADGKDFVRKLLRDPYTERQRDPNAAIGDLLTVFDASDHPWIRHRGALSGAQLDEGVRQRLASTHNRNLLDAAVGNLVAARLQPGDVEVLTRQFDLLDTNGDGHVTLDEYLQGVASLEVTYDELRRQFAAYDTDSDGRISKQEFLSACLSQNLGEAREAQADSFAKLAAQLPNGGMAGKRQITPKSLVDALKRMGSCDDADALAKGAMHAIAEADLDEDGMLSFDEFRTWVERRNGACTGQLPPAVDAPVARASRSLQRGGPLTRTGSTFWSVATPAGVEGATDGPLGARARCASICVRVVPALVAAIACGGALLVATAGP